MQRRRHGMRLLLGIMLSAWGVTAQDGMTSDPIASDANRLAHLLAKGHGMRRGRGRPHHYSVFSEKAPCATIDRQYVSSPLEQKWFAAAAKWKEDGDGTMKDITPYCTLLTETHTQIERMLELTTALMAANTTLSDVADADEVLSYFIITMQCGPYQITHKEHIESLVAALRHPFSIQCPANFSSLPARTSIFDRSYMVLASWAGQVQAARNKYYLDAGAGIGYRANGNQIWTIESYAARGITLDRALYWEASSATGNQIFDDVPPELFPVFSFYNIPAPEDLSDGRNPLNVVTRLAKPEDFVSVKLDIDNPSIEKSWLDAIVGDGPGGAERSRYAELIDELFWEHHFNFMPMRDCCWVSSVDFDTMLVDSMRTFIQLRELGIRSHYWQ